MALEEKIVLVNRSREKTKAMIFCWVRRKIFLIKKSLITGYMWLKRKLFNYL